MGDFDRVQAKRTARQAMKAQRPHPMLITLLFIVLVNIGSQLVSRILGAASGLNDLSALFATSVLGGADAADPGLALQVLQYALLSFGPGRIVLAVLVGGVLADVIVSLWSGIMRVGYSDFCLQMVRGRQPQTGVLFSAFPNWAGVLFTQFLLLLFQALWATLFGVIAILALFLDALLFINIDVLFALVALVIYVGAIVGLVWVLLRYALVDFLIADQGLTGMDAIRESKRLMKGNTGKLFLLQLSFIGWYLLEIAIMLVVLVPGIGLFYAGLGAADLLDPLSIIAGGALALVGLALVASIIIGIFNLWLTPYITAAQALFYHWVQGHDISYRPGTPNGGNPGGWGQHHDYTWTDHPTSSGTGIGSGPRDDDGHTPPPPKPPRPPRDDPWN